MTGDNFIGEELEYFIDDETLIGEVYLDGDLIFQADDIGCQIITVTNDILKKLPLVGYDLNEYSLDTVKMFYADAVAAGFKL